MAIETQSPVVLRFGTFELDLRSGELRKQGLRVKLQEQPFRVLSVLLRHPGEVVNREELRSQIWPADTFVDFDNGLNTAINKLREALGDSADSPRFIETLPRRGYRFIGSLKGSEHSFAAAAKPIGRRGLGLRFSAFAALAVIAVTAVLMGVNVRGWRDRLFLPHTGPPIQALAVLPLANLSGDPEQEYFTDGMTDSLIANLSKIGALRVISRTSILHYKGTNKTLPEIARELNVDGVVEGSVMRSSNRVRITVQLIQARTDQHLWTETYERDLGDILKLQSEVAQSIAQEVAVAVTGEEHERLTRVRSVAPQVYESYLKGWSALDRSRGRASIEEGIAYFEEAINRDPTFAPAYVGLGTAYTGLSTVFFWAPPEEARQKVMSAAQRALELDPASAAAYVLLADTQQKQWKWAEAETEYRRAIELNPNDSGAHLGLAKWLLSEGRTEEAVAWARRARELDPVGVSGADIGWILFQARRYDEAMRELRSVLAVRPDNGAALWVLGFVLIAKNQPEQAIPVLEKEASISQRSPGSIELLATAYAHVGHRSQALRLIDELKRRRQTSYVPAGAFINPCLALGDYDQAFAWFERAYQEQSNILQFLKVHPFFDPVRNDPRFADLVRRVGLPP